MCLENCSGRPSRREVLVGGAWTLAAAAGPRRGDARRQAVSTEEIQFANGTAMVPAMLFRPEAKSAPTVLVADGNPGFAGWLKELCTRIAARGYPALYVDWMSPHFPPYPEAEAEQVAWKKEAGSATLWYTAATDFDAGARWMREHEVGSPEAPVALGFCGGGVVLAHHASEHPALRALILFYANARISTSFANPDDPLPDLVDIAADLDVPIQAHYGLVDPTAKVEDAREFERRLVAAKLEPEFHYYPDAGHGFMKAGEPLEADHTWGYVEAAATAAEQRVFERLAPRSK